MKIISFDVLAGFYLPVLRSENLIVGAALTLINDVFIKIITLLLQQPKTPGTGYIAVIGFLTWSSINELLWKVLF